MKHILVTGPYGFLGKYVIKELVTNGYHVIAFGRNADKMNSLKSDDVDIVVGDFCNLDDDIKATKGVDCVIHCGALSTVWGRRSDFIDTNVTGTMRLVEACRRNGVGRFVYVSSPSVYSGKEDRLNIKEEDYDSQNRLNFYIESKIMAEKALSQVNDLDWVIVRPRGLFGIGDTSIIPRLIKANEKIGVPLFNNGENLVDITCVENVAYALRLCAESDKAVGNTYNITNGEPQGFKRILECLFDRIGVRPRYLNVNIKLVYGYSCLVETVYKLLHIYKEPTLTRYNVCTLGYSQTLDISRAKRDLGYEPKITILEGIENYAREYNKNKLL